MDPSTSPIGAFEPGFVLGGTYHIVAPIGSGGMGRVYEAAHARLPGRFAVKVLSRELGSHDEALRRFRREAEVTSRLRHPNVVQVLDFDQLPDGTPYMVMELLDGRDLARELVAVGRMSPERVADIVEQAAAGLEAAHAEAVIHRDLKPANVFIVPVRGSSRELVKLVDFGISKVLVAASQLTHANAVIGTPQYMSPEQARGATGTLDVRTDQFSLATIAYELLAGRPAFVGDGFASVLYQVVHEPAADLVATGIVDRPAIDQVLRKAMAKRPEDRFASVAAFAAAFRAAVRGEAVVTPPPVPHAALKQTALANSVPPLGPSSAIETSTLTGVASVLETPAAAQPRRPRALGIALAGAAAAIAVVLALRDRTPPPPPPPIVPPVAAAPTPAPSVAAAPPATITVEVHGPPGLVATIAGKPLPLPLVLPAGDERRTVTFAAPGHLPEERGIGGRRDLVIELSLRPRPSPSRRPRGDERGKAKSPNVFTDL